MVEGWHYQIPHGSVRFWRDANPWRVLTHKPLRSSMTLEIGRFSVDSTYAPFCTPPSGWLSVCFVLVFRRSVSAPGDFRTSGRADRLGVGLHDVPDDGFGDGPTHVTSSRLEWIREWLTDSAVFGPSGTAASGQPEFGDNSCQPDTGQPDTNYPGPNPTDTKRNDTKRNATNGPDPGQPEPDGHRDIESTRRPTTGPAGGSTAGNPCRVARSAAGVHSGSGSQSHALQCSDDR